jgi:DNA primase
MRASPSYGPRATAPPSPFCETSTDADSSRVADDLEDTAAVVALAHELGHVLLNHPTRPLALASPSCRGVWKIEADSVAYLVLRHLGMDPSVIGFPSVSS